MTWTRAHAAVLHCSALIILAIRLRRPCRSCIPFTSIKLYTNATPTWLSRGIAKSTSSQRSPSWASSLSVSPFTGIASASTLPDFKSHKHWADTISAAWNVGCVLYIFWVGGQCLFQAINVLVWRDNVINVAPVWCDICELAQDVLYPHHVELYNTHSHSLLHRRVHWGLHHVPGHQPPLVPHRQCLVGVYHPRGQAT